MKTVLIILTSCLVVGSGLSGRIEFKEGDLSFHTQHGYDVLNVSGCDLLDRVGEPLLPVKNIYVAIPSGMKAESVWVAYDGPLEIEGEYRIYPSQPPKRISSDGHVFVEPNPSIYESSNPYPPTVVELKGSGSLGGHHIASLQIFPLRYIPTQGKLYFFRNVDFGLVLSEDADAKKILIRTPRAEESYHNLVKSMVINPQDVMENVADNVGFSLSDEVVEYLIITDPAYVLAFEQLTLWKAKKGVPAEVVTTSWIYGNYAGEDSQDMIRNCIDDYRTAHGTAWVLLGGDASVVPYRGCYGYVDAEPPATDSQIPCDLYYSELDADWDANENGVYGEVSDIGSNLYPDVWVGRAPVNSSTEASRFVSKVLTYEANPPEDYALKVLFLAEYADASTDFAIVKNMVDDESVPSRFDPITKFYESTGNLNKSSTISAMNSGYNLINHAGHANATTISIGSDDLLSSDMYNLTNSPRYSLFYSLGCYSGAFDSDCILEKFVLSPNGGGFSIGNSRYGWYSPGNPGWGSSDKYERRFWYELFNHNTYRIGMAHGEAKAYYIGQSSSNGSMRWCHFCLNLFGDPEMPIWTDTPQTMEVSCPEWIPPGATDFTVSVSDTHPIADALVCLMKDPEIYEANLTDLNGVATFAIEPLTDDTMWVTVTKENYKPGQEFTKVVSAPIAYFSATSVSGQAPLEVQFLNESQGVITDYDWDLGDGPGSQEPNPLHTYSRGAFDVTLRVSGPYGADTLTREDYIKVWDDSVWVTDGISGPVEKLTLDVFLKWSGGPYGSDSVSEVNIPLSYDSDFVTVDTMIVGNDFIDWTSVLSWSDSTGKMLIHLQNLEENQKPEGIYHAAEIGLQVCNVIPPETTYIDTAPVGSPPQYLHLVDQTALSIVPDFRKGAVEILGFACGDCNGDGNITFADGLYLKNYYYQTPPGSPPPLGEGDVNVDGKITSADGLYLKNFYYQTPPGSPPPCEPGLF